MPDPEGHSGMLTLPHFTGAAAPYTHGYYKVSGRVGEAFRDGLKLKQNLENYI